MRRRVGADLVAWPLVERAFRRFGFLYPETLAGLSNAVPVQGAPLGLSIGTLTRTMPPLRMDVLNIGCAACHAGPVYGADGTPDVTKAVPGMPNTSLDLEAFTATAYAALKRALADEPGLMAAIERLFPQMGLREKLTLRWLAIPRGKGAIAKLQASIDRPLPFPNGVPGSTNGVAALKHQLRVTARDRFHDGAGFVSMPVLADRFWRSALLADGAYVAKNRTRFRADRRRGGEDTRPVGVRRHCVVLHGAQHGHVGRPGGRPRSPSWPRSCIGCATSQPRAIPARSTDRARLRGATSMRAPARPATAATMTASSARGCRPFRTGRAMSGPIRSRVEAFTPTLTDAVRATLHGRTYLDAASTGKTAAPLLVRRLGERALFRERLSADDPPPARARDPPGPLHGRRAPARSRPARHRRNRDGRRQLGLSGRLLAVLGARHDRHDEARLLQCRARRRKSAASRPRNATR